MAEFREFYVQVGAGSNFLAGKCLWAHMTDDAQVLDGNDNPLVNEFSFDREQINKVWNGIKRIPQEYKYDDEDLISESKRILPILVELRQVICEVGDKHLDKLKVDVGYIDTVIAEIKTNDFWKVDWSMCTPYFWKYNGSNLVTDTRVDTLLQEAKDYFVKCREYYFKICEQNNWNSSIITHQHPHIAISSQLKLPTTFKSLAMEIDADVDFYIRHLVNIKHIYSLKRLQGKEYFKNQKIDKTLHEKIEDLYDNRSCKFADDSVSYRKIFFENNTDEIRKMYKFFDNEAHFDVNKTSIIKEFKEYNDDNMTVLKRYVPNVYEKM
jgi:hypothetical protein